MTIYNYVTLCNYIIIQDCLQDCCTGSSTPSQAVLPGPEATPGAQSMRRDGCGGVQQLDLSHNMLHSLPPAVRENNHARSDGSRRWSCRG
jgi:hypothetical protein